MDYKWCACISQTGKELYEICEARMRKPDILIITNPKAVCKELLDLEIDEVCYFNGRPKQGELDAIFAEADLITLHGYLYILPEQLVQANTGKLFNGHPGAIHLFPELAGKDPQHRAWVQSYPFFGTVIHEVIAEVDKGKLIDWDEIPSEYVKNEGELFIILKKMSVNLWTRFLNTWESKHEAGLDRSAFDR